MAKQAYIIPLECVEHLMDESNEFTDRNKVKQIGTKCGEIITLTNFERSINNGDLVLSLKTVILID